LKKKSKRTEKQAEIDEALEKVDKEENVGNYGCANRAGRILPPASRYTHE
jgi:hypothetical protein